MLNYQRVSLIQHVSIINFVIRCYQDMLDLYLSIECKDTTEILWIELLYNVAFSIGRTSILGVAPSYRCDGEWRPCHWRAGQDHGREGHRARRYRVHLEDFGCGGWKSEILLGFPSRIQWEMYPEKKAGASYLPKLVYYCMLPSVYSNVSKTMSCLPTHDWEW